MSLRFHRFIEQEYLPKKRYATFTANDGNRWSITLTLHFNREAATAGVECIENKIYDETPSVSERKESLTRLFITVVDFGCLPYIKNSITRVRLYTKVGRQTPDPLVVSVPGALRNSTQLYMGLPLDNLVCLVDDDKTSAIPYTPSTTYAIHGLRSIPYKSITRISKLRGGTWKVKETDGNELLVFKEPKTPEDIKSQRNEIESLVRLSGSRHIIELRGLVVSKTPYLTRPGDSSPRVVRGLLFAYAAQGDLGDLLTNENLEISWSRRLRWACQIVSGLQDIHYARIPHMDLKSKNVVVDEADNAVIIDLSSNGCTYGYQAPETRVDKDHPKLSLETLQRADIYSLGALLWEIMTREEVFIPIGVQSEEFFLIDHCSAPEKYKELVTRCLDHSPDNRPTLAYIALLLRKLSDEHGE
jgi:serine/threonine protein kinase